MMVSAKPNSPKGPLVSESCSNPTSRPTSSAESELPSRPLSATSTRKMSITRPKSGEMLMPMKCTSAASAMAARSLRVCTGVGLFDVLGSRLVVEQVDLVQGAEVDGRGELDLMEELPARLDRDHGAHGDAARVDAVDAGGQHAVARPHIGLQGDVVELEPAAAPAAAAHHPLPAVAQDHAADARGAVGDELDLGVRSGHGDHPAHQAVGREDRLVAARGSVAGVEHQRTQPGSMVDV